MTEAMGVPVSQDWESVRKCGTAVQACLQRQAVCVNVLPGLTMGVGCSRWYLKEKEWEREEGLIHFTPMWAHKNSQHVRACVWVHERLRARVGVQFGRVADCWLAVSSFSSPFIFRTPGFSVLTEREVHNNTRERQIEEKKKKEKRWAWGKGGHLSPLSLI